MKRLTALFLVVFFCINLLACGATQSAPSAPATSSASSAASGSSATPPIEAPPQQEAPPPEEPPEEVVVNAPETYEPTTPVELDSALADISASRSETPNTPTEFSGFSAYLAEDPSTANLVTADEISLLRNGTGSKPHTVSYEDAAYDADLLARAFKAGYGAYYYFGTAAFDKAHADTMAWLQGKSEVPVSEFEAVLQQNYSFIRDAHASVAPSQEDIEGVRRDDCWTYFYCNDAYQQDETGFYKLAGGEKWYYDGCGNDAVTMQRSLTADGKVVYSPVQFCPTTELEPVSTVRLLCGGTVAYEEIIWTAGNPYPNGEGGYFQFNPDYRMEQTGGITYISLRNTDQQQFPKEFAQFIKSGTAARDSKAVILDIRSNAGGGSNATYEWFRNFTGTDLKLDQVSAVRASVLNGLTDGASIWQQTNTSTSAPIENTIPIFVLVDDCVGSGGEVLMQALRTVENAVIVGSNTKGCSLCGNSGEFMVFNLPNSQIHFNFGSVLGFIGSTENVDDIGYTPDLWCDPESALDRVLKLIADSGLAEETACSKLAGKLYQISLRWYADFHQETFGRPYFDVSSGRRFGHNEGTYTIEIKVNGQRVTGFTVLENQSPETCQFTISPEGDLVISVVGSGESIFTIGYQGATASFTWFAGEGPTDPIPPAQGSHKISLRWYLNGLEYKSSFDIVKAGTGLGTSGGTQYIDVLVDGKHVTDFEILSNADDSVCRLSHSPEGYLVLKVIGPGSSNFTIGYGDSQASFRWVSGNGPELMGGPDEITLHWYRKYADGSVKPIHIEPGEGFGDPKRGLQDMVVLVNGEPVTDFTVESSNPNSPVSITPDGHISLDSGVGESWLTVTYGDSFGNFRWAGADN